MWMIIGKRQVHFQHSEMFMTFHLRPELEITFTSFNILSVLQFTIRKDMISFTFVMLQKILENVESKLCHLF